MLSVDTTRRLIDEINELVDEIIEEMVMIKLWIIQQRVDPDATAADLYALLCQVEERHTHTERQVDKMELVRKRMVYATDAALEREKRLGQSSTSTVFSIRMVTLHDRARRVAEALGDLFQDDINPLLAEIMRLAQHRPTLTLSPPIS